MLHTRSHTSASDEQTHEHAHPLLPARGCGEARGNVATVEAPCSAVRRRTARWVARKAVILWRKAIRVRSWIFPMNISILQLTDGMKERKSAIKKKSRVRGSVFCEMWNTMQTQNCRSTENSTVWQMSGSEVIASSSQVHVIKSVTAGTMIYVLAFLWL